jgi:hypothetical protein
LKDAGVDEGLRGTVGLLLKAAEDLLTGGPDTSAGRIGDCERALLRAGFHVEYAGGTAGECLVAWRRSRVK